MQTPFGKAIPSPGKAAPLLVSVGLLVLATLAYLALNTLFLNQHAKETRPRAQFFATAIDNALARLSHLPYVVSINEVALQALTGGTPEILNPILSEIADRSGAEFVYVMDLTGKTIASSNYLAPDSLVGRHYTFRPYFTDALAGRVGHFYAVGVTTGRPGYFISEAIRDAGGTIHGVAVVKVGLADLAAAVQDSGELVLVTNPQGIVVVSSDAALLFGQLSPLSAQARDTLEQQQQFGDRDLTLLDWSETSDWRVRLNGTSYVWTKVPVAREDWTLHLLSDVRNIRLRALLYVAVGLMVLLSLAISASLWKSAQLRSALAISDADRQRLAREIEERRIAQAKLQAAQEELTRTSRLTALGQLSASITHELGQPISAMRNYLAAEEIASDAVPGQLSPQLTGLVDRMQRIIDQLRSFGRRPVTGTGRFDIGESISGALQLVRHDLENAGIEIETKVQAPLYVSGQKQLLEQVLINLALNAIDAIAEADPDERRITLTARAADGSVIIAVSDTGTGLGDLSLDDLREPFFTTKASGKGMGLGLAISAQIVSEMGGTLNGQNAPDGGATFSIQLPEADDADT